MREDDSAGAPSQRVESLGVGLHWRGEELAQILQSEFDAATAPGECCDRSLALARLHLEQRGDEEPRLHWTGKAQEARQYLRRLLAKTPDHEVGLALQAEVG